jgi:vacuolar ATPase assembly integral membrane protein VMA21
MVVGPIGTYFLTFNTVFKGMLARLERENVTWMMLTWTAGNSTFAGATAAVMANVVLVAYVVIAMREDQSEAIEAAEKEKKAR